MDKLLTFGSGISPYGHQYGASRLSSGVLVSVDVKSGYTAYWILELMGGTRNQRSQRRSHAKRANRASSWRFLLPSRTKVPFRLAHLAREVPTLRIRLFGIRDIEGMGGSFLLVLLWCVLPS